MKLSIEITPESDSTSSYPSDVRIVVTDRGGDGNLIQLVFRDPDRTVTFDRKAFKRVFRLALEEE